MSKTLLVILSYAKANDTVARHWPYYLRADCDILGVGRTDTDCIFPKERLVASVASGKDSYVDGNNLCLRILDAIAWAVVLFKDKYSDLLLTEHDAIFTRPVPLHPGGLVTTIAGGKSPGFLGSRFFHGPWWFDRGTAAMAQWCGVRMLNVGLIEQGFPDRWLGLMDDLYDLNVKQAESYSVNTIDRPEYVEQARKAIQAGAYYVHGIKTAEQLEAVTRGLL